MKNILRWIALPFASIGATLLMSLIGYWMSCGPTPFHEGPGPDTIKLLSISAIAGYVFSQVSYSVAPSHKKAACVIMTILLCVYFLLFGFLDVMNLHVKENVGGYGMLRWAITLVASIVTTVVYVKKE